MLLLGSSSYALRAKDPSTLTHAEAKLLAEKKAKHGDSVLPILMAGRIFVDAFPPGYNDTLGAILSQPSRYFQNLPTIVAELLRVSQHPEVKNFLYVAKLSLVSKFCFFSPYKLCRW